MLIINANILPLGCEHIPNGYISIDNDKITSVGHMNETPHDDNALDAKGQYVTPGLIDAHCHLGLFPDGRRVLEPDFGDEFLPASAKADPSVNTEKSDELCGNRPKQYLWYSKKIFGQSKYFHNIRALQNKTLRKHAENKTQKLSSGSFSALTSDRCFREALYAGVTTAVISPCSARVMGGLVFAVKTYKTSLKNMILRHPLAVKVAFGENTKKDHEEIVSYLTNILTNPKLNYAVHLLLSREIPLHAHAHTARDIASAVDIARKFNLRLKLIHCTDAQIRLDLLKSENIEVLLGPIICARTKPELINHDIRTPAQLTQAGIKIAIVSDHPEVPSELLTTCAGVAVRAGMDRLDALRAITINAAQIAEIDDSVGSIVQGKIADIVIWDGFPLDISSNPSKIIAGGVEL